MQQVYILNRMHPPSRADDGLIASCTAHLHEVHHQQRQIVGTQASGTKHQNYWVDAAFRSPEFAFAAGHTYVTDDDDLLTHLRI